MMWTAAFWCANRAAADALQVEARRDGRSITTVGEVECDPDKIVTVEAAPLDMRDIIDWYLNHTDARRSCVKLNWPL